MLWKKTLLQKAKLYLVLDRAVHSYQELFDIAREAIEGGVDIIQIRDKSGTNVEIIDFATKVSDLTSKDVPLIINDNARIAAAVGASGVHLGQDDMPVNQARIILGDEAIIGKSCQTFEQALKAQEQGADYIGFGSVFKTLTKPDRNPMPLDLLKKVVNEMNIPVFAIGGITSENIDLLIEIGVSRVALTRAISQSNQVRAQAWAFQKKLTGDSLEQPLRVKDSYV